MGTQPAAGDLLHYDCGMHRGSSPTTDGRQLEDFEREGQAHRAAGYCARHAQATAIPSHPGDQDCSACGQGAIYHGVG